METVSTAVPAHTSADSYTWRPLGADVVEAWADLVNHLAVVDGTEEFFRAEDLLEELEFDGFDPARDSLSVWDGDVMVGFVAGIVSRTPDHEGQGRGYLDGGVRESNRGRGLGRALMDAMEPRVVGLVAERHPGRPAYLRAGGGLEGSSAEAMLTRRGYHVVRYFNELTRPLAGGVEVPQPECVRLVSPGPEHEEATRLAHNVAFRDHWGSGETTETAWHQSWTGRSARADQSTLALGPDSEVLAYVLCSEYVDRHLYVNLVGTVQAARGRGLAQAALLRTIDLAGRSGRYDVVELGVDSDSPTGATRLYERVGFIQKIRTTALQRALRTT